MMWLSMILEIARAGCTVDADGEARRASAGLVVSGTVVQVALSPEEGSDWARVRHWVRVDRAYKGAIASGYLALDAVVTGSLCPGDRVHAVGDRVYAIGNPDEGSLPISVCTADTGSWTEETDAWLSKLAKGKGQRYPGLTPPAPLPPPAPMPEAGTLRIRAIASSQAGVARDALQPRSLARPIEGRVITADEGATRALFDLGDLTLALWVADEGLAVVPVREARLSGDETAGITVYPGAPVTWGEGLGEAIAARIDAAGMQAVGTLPRADRGTAWTPSAARRTLPLTLIEPTSLWNAPGGSILAALSPHDDLSLQARGPVEGDLLPVEISTPWARAVGFVQASAVMEGAMGGIEGGAFGGRTIELAPGVLLVSQSEAPVTFGRVTETTWVHLLAMLEDSALVAVDTPWGRMDARVSCAPPLDEGVCRAP